MAEGLTPELLVYGYPMADDPQVSPDGTSIAYRLTKVDRESNRATSHIWICDIDGANQRQLTQSGHANGSPRWSPDGRQIAFVSDRSGKTGLYVLPVSQTGEPRLVTEYHAGIDDPVWSPDGSRIAFTAAWDPTNPEGKAPDQDAAPPVRVTGRIDYKLDGEGYLADTRPQVFVVNVETSERRMITRDAVDHHSPRWSPDGKTLAVGVAFRAEMHSRLALIDVESEELHYVTPKGGAVTLWSWSPDGSRILYAGDTVQMAQSDFFVYDVTSDETRRLTDDLQVAPAAGFFGMAGPYMPVWLDNERALFGASRAGAGGIYTVSASSGEVKKLYDAKGILEGLSVDDAHRYVVQGFTNFDADGEIHVYDMKTGNGSVVTEFSKAVFAEHPPAQWERFEVRQGKYDIEAWLLKPADFDPTKKYPVVLDVHGGPQLSWGYFFYPLHQVLATNDVLVVAANPRGSNTYGREFTEAVVQDFGGEDYKDLMAVMDYVVELPYVDETRTGISGYSYGGYMTSWVLGQTDRFRAAICGAPCYDLESFFGTSDIGFSFGRRHFGASPHEARDFYEARSPSTFAHRATTPTLIVQGEADERCPIGQGEQMFVALKKANCEVEFARYPGGDHLFFLNGNPAHREDFLARSLAWFNDHLGEPA